MSSSSSFDTLHAAIIVFVVFSTLQNVSIPPHFVAICLFVVVVVVVEHCCFVYISHNSSTKVVAVWYGVLVAVIVGVWCLFLLLNSSFSYSYYDYPGMSISKAPPACSCFEELFKVLLKTVA
jgi:hypothetical protein